MKIIFIHIPKTGGSTFTNLLRCIFQPDNKKLSHFITFLKKDDIEIYIKHLQFNHPKRLSMCGDIFQDLCYDKYKNYKIYTIIRHPVDRIVSEFIFQKYILRNGPKIRKINVDTFHEYIEDSRTWNYQTSFLLGNGLLTENKITEIDYNHIIYIIEKYNIFVGVTEDYDNFLNLFQENTGIRLTELTEQIEILKESNKEYKSEIILTDNLIDRILENNKWDYKLYKYCKNKINNNNNININWKHTDKFKF